MDYDVRIWLFILCIHLKMVVHITKMLLDKIRLM